MLPKEWILLVVLSMGLFMSYHTTVSGALICVSPTMCFTMFFKALLTQKYLSTISLKVLAHTRPPRITSEPWAGQTSTKSLWQLLEPPHPQTPLLSLCVGEGRDPHLANPHPRDAGIHQDPLTPGPE